MTYSKDCKNFALELRSQGKSYKEIKEAIGVPKSTLSDWLGPHQWSNNIAQQLAKKSIKGNVIRLMYLNKVKKKHLNRLYKQARKEAEEEFEKLKYHPLFIASLCLYWGEGDRATRYGVRISNTDPAMIKLFHNFLTEICQVDKRKIKISLLLYPDLDEEFCKNFWVENTAINKDLFNKSTIIKGRHKTRRLPYGVCNLVFTSTYLKCKIKVWLKILPRVLLSEDYYKYAGIV